jgi:hypothetical protein
MYLTTKDDPFIGWVMQTLLAPAQRDRRVRQELNAVCLPRKAKNLGEFLGFNLWVLGYNLGLAVRLLFARA